MYSISIFMKGKLPNKYFWLSFHLAIYNFNIIEKRNIFSKFFNKTFRHFYKQIKKLKIFFTP